MIFINYPYWNMPAISIHSLNYSRDELKRFLAKYGLSNKVNTAVYLGLGMRMIQPPQPG